MRLFCIESILQEFKELLFGLVGVSGHVDIVKDDGGHRRGRQNSLTEEGRSVYIYDRDVECLEFVICPIATGLMILAMDRRRLSSHKSCGAPFQGPLESLAGTAMWFLGKEWTMCTIFRNAQVENYVIHVTFYSC